MTILVTGGTGLVGSRLLRRLVAAGVDCRALVRPAKELPAGVTGVEGGHPQPQVIASCRRRHFCDHPSRRRFSDTKRSRYLEVNLEGTRNLIAAAKDHAPRARFVMASTSNVYHPDSAHPGREDDPVNPTLAYPASKVDAENELQKSGLNWNVLRLPFIYGEKDGHLESVPGQLGAMNWHPARKMSLLHHKDVGTAFTLALNGATDGRIVNITDDAPTTLYEIAQIVGATYEPSAEPLVNPWMLHMDGSLARSLGFRPTMTSVHQASAESAL